MSPVWAPPVSRKGGDRASETALSGSRLEACEPEETRKSVPFCSILFCFVCEAWVFWERFGALLRHEWSLFEALWNELKQRADS